MFKIFSNETHTIMSEQESLLNSLGDFEIVSIPSSGWNIEQQNSIFQKYKNDKVVFLSPVPLLLALFSANSTGSVFLFHNDRRNKKELPNGNIISVVSEHGWQLIKIR